jgi:acyl carrier protein
LDKACRFSTFARWLAVKMWLYLEFKQPLIKMENLILKLKEEIIDVLNLQELKPGDIDENASLFGEGLGLDSIDALELIVLMEKNYGIKLKDPAQGKEIFKSIKIMAEYIAVNRTK